jgi:hypothetical protein
MRQEHAFERRKSYTMVSWLLRLSHDTYQELAYEAADGDPKPRPTSRSLCSRQRLQMRTVGTVAKPAIMTVPGSLVCQLMSVIAR